MQIFSQEKIFPSAKYEDTVVFFCILSHAKHHQHLLHNLRGVWLLSRSLQNTQAKPWKSCSSCRQVDYSGEEPAAPQQVVAFPSPQLLPFLCRLEMCVHFEKRSGNKALKFRSANSS